MGSPNGAQSLDRPLGTIGHGNKPGNLSPNLRYSFNSLLTSVISNSIPEEMHHQNPSPSSSSCSFLVRNGGDIPDRNDDEDDDAQDHASAIEDFLIRTGTADVASQIAGDRYPAGAGEEWLHFQLAAAAAALQPHPPAMDISGCYGGRVSKYERSGLMEDCGNVVGYNNSAAVANKPMGSEAAAAEKLRRCSEDLKEKTMERKQKRMIKNRESAARSRARKQAYTLRLEEEVLRVRKMNEWLIKKKEVETQILSSPMPQKYQLRRINSASF